MEGSGVGWAYVRLWRRWRPEDLMGVFQIGSFFDIDVEFGDCRLFNVIVGSFAGHIGQRERERNARLELELEITQQ